jgi:predicted SAM-dependent methyltransferase
MSFEKLNIGSGSKVVRGVVNLDIERFEGIDVQGDARYLPFKNEVFTTIYALDLIEHLKYAEVEVALKDWYRVLKPNGILIIKTPNLKTICQLFLQNAFDCYEASRRIFGNELDHKFLFDSQALKNLLLRNGFQVINIREQTDDSTTNGGKSR